MLSETENKIFEAVFPQCDRNDGNIKRLQQHQLEILYRLSLGQRSHEIAAELGISKANVAQIQNCTLGRAKLADLNGAKEEEVKAMSERIKALAPKALKVLEGVLDSPGVQVKEKIKVAIDLLDRSGFGAPRTLAGVVQHQHVTSDDLLEIKRRAREAAAQTYANEAAVEV